MDFWRESSETGNVWARGPMYGGGGGGGGNHTLLSIRLLVSAKYINAQIRYNRMRYLKGNPTREVLSGIRRVIDLDESI
jgi:hypothetical protein